MAMLCVARASYVVVVWVCLSISEALVVDLSTFLDRCINTSKVRGAGQLTSA